MRGSIGTRLSGTPSLFNGVYLGLRLISVCAVQTRDTRSSKPVACRGGFETRPYSHTIRACGGPRSADAGLSRFRALRPRRLRDQPRAALAGEVRPEPLALHAQAVLQLRQREDVNERPHQPRQEAACLQPASL